MANEDPTDQDIQAESPVQQVQGLYGFVGNDLYRLAAPSGFSLISNQSSAAVNPNTLSSGAMVNNIDIQQNVIQGGKSSFTDTEAGFILGDNSGTYEFLIGGPNSSLFWDGVNINIQGNLNILAPNGDIIGTLISNGAGGVLYLEPATDIDGEVIIIDNSFGLTSWSSDALGIQIEPGLTTTGRGIYLSTNSTGDGIYIYETNSGTALHIDVSAGSYTGIGMKVAGEYHTVEYNNGSVTGTATINWLAGNVQYVTLTGATTFTFSNPQPGMRCILHVAGAYTPTFPGTVRWPAGTTPTATASAGHKDIYTFVYSGVESLYDGAQLANYAIT